MLFCRLEKASSKIESLKLSKKSIRIYSPAKYPIANPPTFRPTFQDDFTTPELEFNYNMNNVPFETTDYKKYSDKLQFFHLKRSRQQTSNKPSLISTKSINSLITFVNNENIIFNDPSPKARVKNQAAESGDGADTMDFSKFSSLMKSKHDDSFHYFPDMSQAPEIELPMDLPDLPGIADDISFAFSEQELIVPSLAKMNIINELPNISDLIEAESTKKLQETPKQSLNIIVQEKIPSPPPVPLNIPPPPPIPQSFVPPPPPIPLNSATPSKAPETKPQSDDRSSLMAAIRAAGKSKLRSVPAADEQVPTAKKKPSAAAPAGDLMSDLHAKLALRRRGIAGSKEAKKEKSSIMDKVSSMIPPPKKKTDSSDDESSNSNSDWE